MSNTESKNVSIESAAPPPSQKSQTQVSDWWSDLVSSRSKPGDKLANLLQDLGMKTMDAVKIASTLRSSESRISISSGLANQFELEYQSTGSMDRIDKAILCRRQAVLFAYEEHTLRSDLFSELGESLFFRFKRLGSQNNIEGAIWCQNVANGLTPTSNLGKIKHLTSLAELWQSKFEQSGDLGAIDKAVDYYQQAVQLTPQGELAIPACLHNLGLLWGSRFEQLGNLEDINKAIGFQVQAVQLTPESDLHRPGRLRNLGTSLQRRFEQLGDLADADQAIKCYSEAVQLTSNDHPDKPMLLKGLGAMWMGRNSRSGNHADISNAIDCHTKAAELTPESHPDKLTHLKFLGSSRELRYERLGNPIDLDEAIQCQVQVVRLAPIGHVDMPGYLNTLGRRWLLRFERLGDLVDIMKAVDCHEKAVQLTPEGHLDKPSRLDDLGHSWIRRFERLGDVADADKAVKCHAQAVHLAPEDHPGKPTFVNNLGTSFSLRFERLGDLEDLQKATQYYTQAVQLTPDDHADIGMHLSNLGNAWQSRFQGPADLAYLEKAIKFHEQAVRFTPQNHSDRPMRLSNLGNSLVHRSRVLKSETEIEEAIICHADAVQLTPEGHAAKPAYLNNLGNSWQVRFEQLGDVADLSKAVEYRTKAVQLTPEGHADKPMYLMNLGYGQQALFERLGERLDLESARTAFKHGAESPIGNTGYQIQCAREWAACSIKLGLSPLQAYRRSFALLPRLVWLGLEIQERYHVLDKISDLAAEGAAWAVTAQLYDLALEWLEEGRSVVWRQILQLRSPFDELALVDPGLANLLKETASQLDGAGSTISEASSSAESPLDVESQAQHHHDLANRWEELLIKARQLPGLHGFMLPQTSQELKKSAIHGPVAMINFHKTRCDALIVLPHGADVIHVPLTQLLQENLQETRRLVFSCTGHRGAGDEARGIKRDRPNKSSDDRPEVLVFLWSCIVGPVLDALTYTQKLAYDDLPHITWCATGGLSWLPLHAAGLYDNSSPNAFDLVISSYTPTLGALIQKSASAVTRQEGVLAVGQANTRGFSPLPKTVEELDVLKKHVKTIRYHQLDGALATVKATLQAMEEHSWVHMACHATQSRKNPSHSAFHLHDGALTLEQIARRVFKDKGLAFLSACQTASGDHKLPDESTHLAAGMLMVGYPSVIATMWSIMDDDAPEIAEEVYAVLLKDGKMDHTNAAKALHKAVGKLREKVGLKAVWRWAPFIHMGL